MEGEPAPSWAPPTSRRAGRGYQVVFYLAMTGDRGALQRVVAAGGRRGRAHRCGRRPCRDRGAAAPALLPHRALRARGQAGRARPLQVRSACARARLNTSRARVSLDACAYAAAPLRAGSSARCATSTRSACPTPRRSTTASPCSSRRRARCTTSGRSAPRATRPRLVAATRAATGPCPSSRWTSTCTARTRARGTAVYLRPLLRHGDGRRLRHRGALDEELPEVMLGAAQLNRCDWESAVVEAGPFRSLPSSSPHASRAANPATPGQWRVPGRRSFSVRLLAHFGASARLRCRPRHAPRRPRRSAHVRAPAPRRRHEQAGEPPHNRAALLGGRQRRVRAPREHARPHVASGTSSCTCEERGLSFILEVASDVELHRERCRRARRRRAARKHVRPHRTLRLVEVAAVDHNALAARELIERGAASAGASRACPGTQRAQSPPPECTASVDLPLPGGPTSTRRHGAPPTAARTAPRP